MPIIVEDSRDGVSQEFEGRVLKVRKVQDRRNVSDTLDYSDYQLVEVVEAFVYKGRTYGEGSYEGDPGSTRPILERFGWVDCSNLFVWRGAAKRTPVVDDITLMLLNNEFIEDFTAYEAEFARAAEAQRIANEARREAEVREQADRIKNAPTKGKLMEVYKGRKVPIGTQGRVAYIHESGSVLLKDAAQWQDRKAPGVWVNARNLRAVE